MELSAGESQRLNETAVDSYNGRHDLYLGHDGLDLLSVVSCERLGKQFVREVPQPAFVLYCKLSRSLLIL